MCASLILLQNWGQIQYLLYFLKSFRLIQNLGILQKIGLDKVLHQDRSIPNISATFPLLKLLRLFRRLHPLLQYQEYQRPRT